MLVDEPMILKDAETWVLRPPWWTSNMGSVAMGTAVDGFRLSKAAFSSPLIEYQGFLDTNWLSKWFESLG